MKTADFDYELPEELIAQDPLPDRSSSRLMILEQGTGKTAHAFFRDIPSFLKEGDVLVINDTKVIPARLLGVRPGRTGKIELLLLRRLENDIWETLARPGKKVRPGEEIWFGDGLLKAKVLSVGEDGNRFVQFSYEGIFEEILDRLGQMPLPPYIHHQLEDPGRYQTVYAVHDGSAAAPTAGLHFTEALMDEIRAKGVLIVPVTLHVGLGTFRPVKAEDIADHHMHSEFYIISEKSAGTINEARKKGGRIIAVGTTSTRTLESAADENGFVKAGSGWTDIFIYPGYRFKVIDELITNFHLPQSTLVMLVSALAGKDQILAAYNEAVRERYRFFSFGDAMYITKKLPEKVSGESI